MSDRRNGHARTPQEERFVAIGRANDLAALAAGPAAEAGDRKKCLADLASDLGPKYSHENTRLEGFDFHGDPGSQARQRAVVEEVRAYAADVLGNVSRGRGLGLYGPTRTGKDRLAAYAGYAAAAAGVRCAWRFFPELLFQLRDAWNCRKPQEALLAPLRLPKVLILSDLIVPSGEVYGSGVDVLGVLLDYRFRQGLITCWTVNAANEGSAAEVLSPPVWERACEAGLLLLPCFWPHYRTTRPKSEPS